MDYYKTGIKDFTIRFAAEEDTGLILQFIKDLAEYEKMQDQVVATKEILHEWIFEKKKAEVLLGELKGKPVAFALFFHNFSTFLGRSGIYLEDLFVNPGARRLGIGKAMLKQLAKLATQRGCGRVEWCCLDWNEPSIRFYLSLGAKPITDWIRFRLSGDTLAAFGKEE